MSNLVAYGHATGPIASGPTVGHLSATAACSGSAGMLPVQVQRGVQEVALPPMPVIRCNILVRSCSVGSSVAVCDDDTATRVPGFTVAGGVTDGTAGSFVSASVCGLAGPSGCGLVGPSGTGSSAAACCEFAVAISKPVTLVSDQLGPLPISVVGCKNASRCD